MDHVTRVEGRKVAVHCHAGLGRTGLAIACFFVFRGSHVPGAAVADVRAGRPGALQTRAQVLFVRVFGQYLAHLRCLFGVRRSAATAARDAAAAAATAAADAAAEPPAPTAAGGEGAEAAAGASSGGGEADGGAAPEGSGGGGAHVVCESGLTIVRPLARASTSAAGGGAVAGGGFAAPSSLGRRSRGPESPSEAELTEEDLGLGGRNPLPWNAHFHIQKRSFRDDFTPEPPVSYEEALHRQQRLLHGAERRERVRLLKARAAAASAAHRRCRPLPPFLCPPPACRCARA